MAAAFSLRQYSSERKRIPNERPSSTPDLSYEKIDLIGGNGRWRQRKAEEEWKRRDAEEAERKRQEDLREEERRRRAKFREERKRKQQEQEKQDLLMERERKERERREIEEEIRVTEEAERARKEAEHKDWLARQPKTCETCAGSGKCIHCNGKGYFYTMFLVSKVDKETLLDEKFGKMMQGCEDCGGCRHNLLGELKVGSGKCATCGGAGKVWPVIAGGQSPTRRHGGGGGGLHLGKNIGFGIPTGPDASPTAAGDAKQY